MEQQTSKIFGRLKKLADKIAKSHPLEYEPIGTLIQHAVLTKTEVDICYKAFKNENVKNAFRTSCIKALSDEITLHKFSEKNLIFKDSIAELKKFMPRDTAPLRLRPTRKNTQSRRFTYVEIETNKEIDSLNNDKMNDYLVINYLFGLLLETSIEEVEKLLAKYMPEAQDPSPREDGLQFK